MKKSSVLQSISKELQLSYENQELFTKFLNKNNQLSDLEFYKEFKINFPWIDYAFKYQNLVRQKRIDNHLLFFKVIVIISMIFGFISALFYLI